MRRQVVLQAQLLLSCLNYLFHKKMKILQESGPSLRKTFSDGLVGHSGGLPARPPEPTRTPSIVDPRLGRPMRCSRMPRACGPGDAGVRVVVEPGPQPSSYIAPPKFTQRGHINIKAELEGIIVYYNRDKDSSFRWTNKQFHGYEIPCSSGGLSARSSSQAEIRATRGTAPQEITNETNHAQEYAGLCRYEV